MVTKLDSRQTISRDTLDQIAVVSGAELDNLLRSINEELTPLLRMLPNTGTDRILNIEDYTITNPETSRKISINPIKKVLPTGIVFPIALTFPAASGGTITISGTSFSASSPTTITVSSSNYIKVGINLDSNGFIKLTFGTQGASLAAATAPAPAGGCQAIGFVAMHNTAGTIDNITNTMIYQYGSGGGGGGISSAEFTIANNVTTATSITDFLVNAVDNKSFLAETWINRYYGTTVGGSVVTAFNTNVGTGFNNTIFNAVVQSDNKVVIGGDFTLLNGAVPARLARLNSDGTLDTTFNTNLGAGVAGTSASVRKIAIQADGKILIAGTFDTVGGVSVPNKIARLNANGTLDTAFNANLGVGIAGGAVAAGVYVLSTGKIIVHGDFTSIGGVSTPTGFARLNANGTLDTTYNTSVGTGAVGTVISVKEQADGKILAGGTFTSFGGSGADRLVRLLTTGAADIGFETNLGSGPDSTVSSIDIFPNGKILIAGTFTTAYTPDHLMLLKPDGTPDTNTFVTNLGSGFDGAVNKAKISSDGYIYVFGNFTSLNGSATIRNGFSRLKPDGTLDTTFNTNIGSDFGSTVWDVDFQSDGSIIVGGDFTTPGGSDRVVKLLADTFINLKQQKTIRGRYDTRAENWLIEESKYSGDADVGVQLYIDETGQIKYTSSDLSSYGSAIVNTMKFIILEL